MALNEPEELLNGKRDNILRFLPIKPPKQKVVFL